jgi:hypothetical protein
MRVAGLVLVLTSCLSSEGAPPAQSPPPVGALDLWVDPFVPGSSADLQVTGAAPGQEVWFALTTRGLGAGPCRLGLCVDLVSPRLLGRVVADAGGEAALTVQVPATASGVVGVQALAWGPDGVTPPVVVDLSTPAADHAALTAGVTSLLMNGALPAALTVWDDHAQPLVLGSDRAPVVAAARVSGGKVLVAGHEGPFLVGGLGGFGDTDRLLHNTLAWMDPTAPRVGVVAGNGGLVSWLLAEGYDARTVNASQLGTVDVLLVPGGAAWSSGDAELVRRWVRYGGNLVVAAQAWWWATSHEELASVGFPPNLLLEGAGVYVSEAPIWDEDFVVSGVPVSDVWHGSRALALLARHETGSAWATLTQRRDAASTVGRTLDALPVDHPYVSRTGQLAALVGPVVPTAAAPVVVADAPELVVVAHHDHKLATELPAEGVEVHPAAADFPGPVDPSAPRLSASVLVRGSYEGRDERYGYAGAGAPRWTSTARYAAPGEIVTVTVPPAAVGQGVRVQIGAHTDTLWGSASWTRFPAVVRSEALDAPVTRIASAFGGPIYLTVPPGTALADFTATVAGGVAMPSFRAGSTTDAAWVGGLRDLPAPWAELHGASFVLTVPAADAAQVDNPTAVMAFWDEVLDAEAWLAALPSPRARQERAVVDRQISAGWMHSGYPFMAHDVSAPDFLDLVGLQAGGDWGAFHELGHNHQWIPWVLPGTTESSVNLFTLVAMEQVVGLPPRTGHPALDPVERAARVQAYLADGADFWADWNVWTALETYLQLQEAFGWELFRELNAQYQLDDPASDPVDDQGRIDRWAVRSSVAAGVDLGPFYLAWGWPVGGAALAEMALLPAWAGDPMAP